jgi:hypothetical protein
LRAHPIVKAGLLLIAFRLGGVAVRYLGQPTTAIGDRFGQLFLAASAHAGALLVLIGLLLALSRAWSAGRRVIAMAACVVFALLMIAGQADLTVATITGAPLTPTLFRTFRGIHVVTSNEFLEPLKANAALVAGGLVLFLAVVAWMTRLIRQDWKNGAQTSWPEATVTIVAGAALLSLPATITWPGPPPPIEVAFAREWLGLDRTSLRGTESDAVRELRATVGLPAHATWLSDEYPLVYGWPDRPAPSFPPDQLDIVVVMIESLRADALGSSGGRPSATPNLDALARRSVVFPTFTSNGFPSAPSVLAFHCSAWPHRRKEIITDFSDRRFDSLPSRLRDFGYDTTYIGADPHFDHQDHWLPSWYSTVIDLVANGEAPTDRNILARGIGEIRRHDAAAPVTPLFEFISTYSTHYPFRLPDDAGERPLPTSEALEPRYRQVLAYTDREVGHLLAFLETRERRDRTILIVLGDHGFYMDLRRTSGLPENDNIWTTAIIAGPERLVGPPRRILVPASHVDMLPTVLALVGDRRPSAALGSDLFGPPRNGMRSAMAVRPGGVRLDRDGASILVDARTPTLAISRVSFPGVMPATGSAAPLSAGSLTDLVADWSYLIERNRVWSPSFLASPSTRR